MLPLGAKLPRAERPSQRLVPSASAGEALEIAGDQGAVEARQRAQIRFRDVLVDPVHGAADEAELDHRAELADEAGVRGAAGGGKLGRAAKALAAGLLDHLHERAWLGQERLAGDLQVERDPSL